MKNQNDFILQDFTIEGWLSLPEESRQALAWYLTLENHKQVLERRRSEIVEDLQLELGKSKEECESITDDLVNAYVRSEEAEIYYGSPDSYHVPIEGDWSDIVDNNASSMKKTELEIAETLKNTFKYLNL